MPPMSKNGWISLDEILASCQFLRGRARAGQPLLRVLHKGDTDEAAVKPEGTATPPAHAFVRSPAEIMRDMIGGGVNLPWNLAAAALIGVWLMCTRLTLGAQGAMANADHIIGSMAVTLPVIACAEVARPVRFLNIPLGVALGVTPFVFDASVLQTVASFVCGIGLIATSFRRGPVRERYAGWNHCIV